MKKYKILSMIAAFSVAASVMTEFPVSVCAAVTTYDLTIAGIQVNYDNKDDILGNGVFSFDGIRTLTVDGSYTFTKGCIDNGISGLTVNTVSDSELVRLRDVCIESTKAVTFKGSGTLTVSGNTCGIYLSNGDMRVNDTTLKVYGGGESASAIRLDGGKLSASSAHILAEGGQLAVEASENAEFSGCFYRYIDGSQVYANNLDVHTMASRAKSVEISPRVNEISVRAAAPVAGAEAEFSAYVTGDGCHLDENYYIDGVAWYDETDNKKLVKGDAFESGHDYKMSVCVGADDDYYFFEWNHGYYETWPVLDTYINGKKAGCAWATTAASSEYYNHEGDGVLPTPVREYDKVIISYTFKTSGSLKPVFEAKTWTAADFGLTGEFQYTSRTLSEDETLALNATVKRPITVDGAKRIKLNGENREVELIAGYSGTVTVEFKHASSNGETRTLSIMQNGTAYGTADVEPSGTNTATAYVMAGHVTITSNKAVNILSVTYTPDEQPSSGMCGDDLFWEYSENVLHITGTGAMYDYNREGDEPWYSYKDSITLLDLSEGITYIGNHAFENNTELRRIKAPKSLTAIGTYSFSGCSSLKYVYYAGDYDGYKAIYHDRYNAPFVEAEVTLAIPSGICGRGQKWRIEGSTLTVSGNWDMDAYTAGGAPWYKYMKARSYNMYYEDDYETVTEVTVQYPVQSIGESAFDSGKSRYESVGDYAPINNEYGGYEDIKTVKIPASVNKIGKNAFYTCSGIEHVFYAGTEAEWNSIDIAEGNDYLKNANIHFTLYGGEFGDGLIWSFDGETLTVSGSGAMPDWTYSNQMPWYSHIHNIKKIVIETGITNIGDYAFMMTVGESVLESVTIPSTVTRIGDYAFSNCSVMQTPELPEGLTYIGNSAFRRCYAFEDITIPEGVKEISHQAFKDCTGLKIVRFPSTIETIGNYAFEGYSSITDMYYNGTNAEWNNVDIGAYNYALLNIERHFIDDTQPTEEPELPVREEAGRLPARSGEKNLAWKVSIPEAAAGPAEAEIIASGDVSEDEPLIAASYSEDGKLIGITMVTDDQFAGMLNTSGAKRVKLMWWNMDRQDPISDSENIGL